jgi:hypothetical protein
MEKMQTASPSRWMTFFVTHSTNIVEHPELVAERLLRFVECVGRHNVMAAAIAASPTRLRK